MGPIDDWASQLLHGSADEPLLLDVEARGRLRELLQRSQRMESLGLLAGGVAHEFNNLLTTILANVQLASEHLQDQEALLEDLRELRAAAERGASVAHQLLATSRPQPLRVEPTDVSALLVRLGRLLGRLVGEQIELAVIAPEHPLSARADPARLEQVLVNLVVNARDAMPSGGRLTLELRAVLVDEAYAAGIPGAPRGACLELAVSDSGVGMSPETMARLFDPLFTTKPLGRGSGLGLMTCREYVHQLGGHIWAWSEAGAGSVFRILLPRSEEQPQAAGVSADARSAVPAGSTLLLVEDDRMVRDALAVALDRFGYRTLSAHSPGDALRIAREHPGEIAVMVSDVVMPEMSGPELAQLILHERPAMRVLFISGYARDSRALGQIDGVTMDFLPKPFAPSALAHRVARLMESA